MKTVQAGQRVPDSSTHSLPTRRWLLAAAANSVPCPPATLCRHTGAAGFIASRIVARLRAAGHTVHATCRPAVDDAATMAALRELPGAQERLRWFAADLLQEGSFDEAIAGCK